MDDEKRVNELASTYTIPADQVVSKPVVLEREGKPVLVLMPYDEYQRLRRIERDARARTEVSTLATTRPKRNTLEKALGLLYTGKPAPSDAEVKEWLHEHRMEKYG